MTDQCQKSFEGVKYALTHVLVLNVLIFGERFEFICDASLLQQRIKVCYTLNIINGVVLANVP